MQGKAAYRYFWVLETIDCGGVVDRWEAKRLADIAISFPLKTTDRLLLACRHKGAGAIVVQYAQVLGDQLLPLDRMLPTHLQHRNGNKGAKIDAAHIQELAKAIRS